MVSSVSGTALSRTLYNIHVWSHMGSQVLLALIPDFARAGQLAGMRNETGFQGEKTGRGWLSLAGGARERRDLHDDEGDAVFWLLPRGFTGIPCS